MARALPPCNFWPRVEIELSLHVVAIMKYQEERVSTCRLYLKDRLEAKGLLHLRKDCKFACRFMYRNRFH